MSDNPSFPPRVTVRTYKKTRVATALFHAIDEKGFCGAVLTPEGIALVHVWDYGSAIKAPHGRGSFAEFIVDGRTIHVRSPKAYSRRGIVTFAQRCLLAARATAP